MCTPLFVNPTIRPEAVSTTGERVTTSTSPAMAHSFPRSLASMISSPTGIRRGNVMELKGKVAVVTGGNGGLGQRICHALAKEGCHIAVVYAQSKDQAEGVARDLEKHQVGAASFSCNVTQRNEVQRLVDDVVKRFGRLDILVNDAAYNKSIPFKDLDNLPYEEWTTILDINLTGPMLMTKAVGP